MIAIKLREEPSITSTTSTLTHNRSLVGQLPPGSGAFTEQNQKSKGSFRAIPGSSKNNSRVNSRVNSRANSRQASPRGGGEDGRVSPTGSGMSGGGIMSIPPLAQEVRRVRTYICRCRNKNYIVRSSSNSLLVFRPLTRETGFSLRSSTRRTFSRSQDPPRRSPPRSTSSLRGLRRCWTFRMETWGSSCTRKGEFWFAPPLLYLPY